jgi:hypothetical protein
MQSCGSSLCIVEKFFNRFCFCFIRTCLLNVLLSICPAFCLLLCTCRKVHAQYMFFLSISNLCTKKDTKMQRDGKMYCKPSRYICFKVSISLVPTSFRQKRFDLLYGWLSIYSPWFGASERTAACGKLDSTVHFVRISNQAV